MVEEEIITFQEILDNIEEMNNSESEIYKRSKRIADKIKGSYKECDNKAKRMTNSYVVEVEIKNYLSKRLCVKIKHIDIGYDFIGPCKGRDVTKPDLIDEYGVTFEVKSLRLSAVEYVYKLNHGKKENFHNADYIIYYDRYSNQLFKIYYNNGRYKLHYIDELIINLPFPKD